MENNEGELEQSNWARIENRKPNIMKLMKRTKEYLSIYLYIYIYMGKGKPGILVIKREVKANLGF